MLAGQCPPKAQGCGENLIDGLVDPFHFLLIVCIGQDRRMEVAVTGMAERTHFQVVLLCNLLAG